MNKTLVGCIALAAFMVVSLFAGPEALAQRGPEHHKPGERVDRHIEMMDERLDLTDEQETQIRALVEAHAVQMRAMREDNDSTTREERRTHLRDSMADLRAEVAGILTDEQAEKLEAMHERMQEHRQDRRARRQDRRDHHKPDMFAELNLSDEQKSQLQSLRETHRAEMKEWREGNPDASREEWRERMRAQAEEHRAALADILTDEQRQQLEEMRASWEARRAEWKDREELNERREGGKERREEKERSWRERHRQHRDAADQSNTADEQAAASRLQLENYPNPFNPSTEIRFVLPEGGLVELSVYDAQGREVQSLLNETLSAGAHSVTFEAGDLPSGVYLYRLSYGGQVEAGRMTLSK